MDFLTGKQLMERWKLESHELMKLITATEIISAKKLGKTHRRTIFNKELTPYAPGYSKPYKVYLASSSFQYIGGHNRFKLMGFPSYVVLSPGNIYESLHEVLFRTADVEAFEEANPRLLSESKSLIRRDIALAMAKRLKQQNPKMEFPDAAQQVNDYFNSYNFPVYSDKQLRNILKDLKFPPGKRGPKTKNNSD